MEKVIENKLQKIFQDFQNELENHQTLCNLKDISFKNNNIPDYSNKLLQQLYLLRYYPAYFVEYFEIFQKIIKSSWLDFPFNIVSIGCGCCIDYTALCFAVKKQYPDYNKDDRLFTYKGFDRIEWYNCDLNTQNFIASREIRDIAHITQLNEDVNILFFPKSIGELNLNQLNSFKETLNNTNFKTNRIIVINSMRESKVNIDSDNMKPILDKLRDLGFNQNSDNDDADWFAFTNNGFQGLNNIFYFSYPSNIQNFIENALINNCNEFRNNGKSCDFCEKNLLRKPILTVNHIAYNIHVLER